LYPGAFDKSAKEICYWDSGLTKKYPKAIESGRERLVSRMFRGFGYGPVPPTLEFNGKHPEEMTGGLAGRVWFGAGLVLRGRCAGALRAYGCPVSALVPSSWNNGSPPRVRMSLHAAGFEHMPVTLMGSNAWYNLWDRAGFILEAFPRLLTRYALSRRMRFASHSQPMA